MDSSVSNVALDDSVSRDDDNSLDSFDVLPEQYSEADDTTRDGEEVSKTAVDSDTEDIGSDSTSKAKIIRRRRKRGVDASAVLRKHGGRIPAECLFEYRWPQERSGSMYVLQEQVSLYLGISSFKRKYPDLTRRNVEMEERNFLHSHQHVLADLPWDLGLTALRRDEVMELMSQDFPEHFLDYQKVISERQKQNMLDQHKRYETIKQDSGKLEELRKTIIQSASSWNAAFNKERKQQRCSFLDIQTMKIQSQVGAKRKVQDTVPTFYGSYPAALVPGQYQHYYKTFSSSELRKLPINKATDLSVYFPKKTCLELANKILDEYQVVDFDEGALLLEEEEVGLCDVAKSDRGHDTGEHCAFCRRDIYSNDRYIQCDLCDSCGHPSCMEMSGEMYETVKRYAWQCMECKPCSVCSQIDEEEKMMFCDRCDRGYHTFCVGLNQLPRGRWKCSLFCGGDGVVTPRSKNTLPSSSSDKDSLGACVQCGIRITKINKVHHRSRFRNAGLCSDCASIQK